jgi:hypothetical protein
MLIVVKKIMIPKRLILCSFCVLVSAHTAAIGSEQDLFEGLLMYYFNLDNGTWFQSFTLSSCVQPPKLRQCSVKLFDVEQNFCKFHDLQDVQTMEKICITTTSPET